MKKLFDLPVEYAVIRNKNKIPIKMNDLGRKLIPAFCNIIANCNQIDVNESLNNRNRSIGRKVNTDEEAEHVIIGSRREITGSNLEELRQRNGTSGKRKWHSIGQHEKLISN